MKEWKYDSVDRPKEDGRYLIAYRYRNNTNLRYFVADYLVNYGWQTMMDNMEVVGWQEIEPFEFNQP